MWHISNERYGQNTEKTEAAHQGVNFIAEPGRRYFSIARLMGDLVSDLLGQNLALIYIITGFHRAGSRCLRGQGVIGLEKLSWCNLKVVAALPNAPPSIPRLPEHPVRADF